MLGSESLFGGRGPGARLLFHDSPRACRSPDQVPSRPYSRCLGLPGRRNGRSNVSVCWQGAVGLVSIGDMWNCPSVFTGAAGPNRWSIMGGDYVTGFGGLINSSHFKVLNSGDVGNATGSPLLDLVGKQITNAASAPTSGTWKGGDFVLNSLFDPNVAAENIIGWYCSAGGTPGKWVALAAVQQVKGAPTGTCQTGSIRSRYDGGPHSTLYVCENGKWAAK
jgi:hypothetical protein